jgi:hypothetical protein
MHTGNAHRQLTRHLIAHRLDLTLRGIVGSDAPDSWLDILAMD